MICSIETVSWIKSSWQIESYTKGSILIEACQSVSDLYILKTGKLSVKALNQDSSKYDVIISELGKGSLIGDMASLKTNPHHLRLNVPKIVVFINVVFRILEKDCSRLQNRVWTLQAFKHEASTSSY